MDLNTITEIVRPRVRAEMPTWLAGDAWLGGGTWLFSEPQPMLSRLVDLGTLGWAPLTVHEEGLEIAATCTIAQLAAFVPPADFVAMSLIEPCCRAFVASFKVWETATVGGNLCLSLPAGPMIALMGALDGICTIWMPNGGARSVPALEFVTSDQANVLCPGELLRKIDLPVAALQRRAVCRKASLTPLGRSAAMLIGTRDNHGHFSLTITAATFRPVQVTFVGLPERVELRETVAAALHRTGIHDDVHGAPAWREHMTLLLAQQIRDEFTGE